MGTGHVMRMLALAQAWKDRGGKATVVSRSCPSKLAERLEKEGVEMAAIQVEAGSDEDARASLQIAQESKSAWVVVDGYGFTESYHRVIREEGIQVMAVDDYGHCQQWDVDAVLNQNPGAKAESYPKASCPLLLGLRYVLLRREFRLSHPQQRERRPPRKLFITFGGGDPDNVSLKVLRALEAHPSAELEIVVACGAASPHLDSLRACAEQSRNRVRIETDIRDMPAVFASVDGVLSAGGSTCYEWMYYRLPAAVAVIADNQLGIYEWLVENQFAVPLGVKADLQDGKSLARAIEAFLNHGQELNVPDHAVHVDGKGAERVAAFLSGELEM